MEPDQPVALPPTLENLFARQSHVILVMERIEKSWNTKLDELAARERKLHGIAANLSEATMKFLAARALASAAPTPARLAALFTGAAAGAYLATWAWMVSHAHLAMASLP